MNILQQLNKRWDNILEPNRFLIFMGCIVCPWLIISYINVLAGMVFAVMLIGFRIVFK